MSTVIAIQQFLVGKNFSIPSYQRDYAWATSQVEDLLEDVDEAIATNSPHYLGTVVLADNGTGPYEIVDGQQRLSTLILIIHALLEQLEPNDEQRIADSAILLFQGQDLKLNFGNNLDFVSSLLSGEELPPETPGQRRLLAAYHYAYERARELYQQGGREKIIQWLDTLKKLEIIEFVAEDTGRAIRMFQTVNDRGLPLSAMDKAKALLIFYSNRYLNGELDEVINEAFGQCFAAYDTMREKASQPEMRIDNIARHAFSEDDLLRYHYLAYHFPESTKGGDWEGSIRTVFDGFLKGTLKQLSNDKDKLTYFIKDYVSDLRSFCLAFQNLIKQAEDNPRLFKYLVVLGVSARLYPLTVRLYQRDMLFNSSPHADIDLLSSLEICDVRVYKTRGTDPAKDIGVISHKSRTASTEEIHNYIQSFVKEFMPDGLFQTYLRQDMYHNDALPLILLEYDEYCSGESYDSFGLKRLVGEQITREHILSKTPSFSVEHNGFDDEDDFASHVNQIGNLTPLTSSENSKCRNKNVHSKMTDPDLYPNSQFYSTRRLAHWFKTGPKQFHKPELRQRTEDLSYWVINTWPLLGT